MVDIYWDSVNKTVVNEQSNIVGVYWPFMGIAGDSILGVDGTPTYEIALESRKHEITDKIKEMEEILASDEIRDNVKPVFEKVEEDKKYIFPKGTDKNSIDWAKEFTAKDNIDGELDTTEVEYSLDEVDFNKAGYYSKGVTASIEDSSGNIGTLREGITIYDAENKTPPTLVMKKETKPIKINQDVAKIKWDKNFVEKAVDKDGIDLKSRVTADLSELNTTVAGEYNVKLSVEDFAGNVAEATIKVKVEEKKE